MKLENIQPTFEEENEIKNETSYSDELKLKSKSIKQNKSGNIIVKLKALDKITAKSVKLTINLDETIKFGPLEIKILKCGKVNINNKTDNVAYMQVKDLTKSEDEKVFIFNGWTFSSDPHITPFDHAIYDLQLINCFNV